MFFVLTQRLNIPSSTLRWVPQLVLLLFTVTSPLLEQHTFATTTPSLGA